MTYDQPIQARLCAYKLCDKDVIHTKEIFCGNTCRLLERSRLAQIKRDNEAKEREPKV